MKKFHILNALLAFLVLAAAPFSLAQSQPPPKASKAPKATKIMVSGCGSSYIAIIDKATKKIEWTYKTPKNDCNYVNMDAEGRILFSYGIGARIINRTTRETLWDYPVPTGFEIHGAYFTENGGWGVAILGIPARIVEFDRKGKQTKEIVFDTGVTKVHSQFRNVTPLKDGSYLIAAMFKPEIMKLTPDGKLTTFLKVAGKNTFSVQVLKDGNYLVSEADNRSFCIVDRQSKMIRRVDEHDLESQGLTVCVGAKVQMLDDGNVLMCNWLGHGSDQNQPMMFEVDPNNKVVWRFDSKELFKRISSAIVFEE